MPMSPDDKFPAKGDVLFRNDLPDFQHNACINDGEGKLVGWYTFVDGYRIAADALAERIFEDRLVLDIVIFPLAFLYRHHLELVLKAIIIIGNLCADKKPPKLTTHRLEVLWKEARRYMVGPPPAADQERMDAAGELLSEFDHLDIGSFAFRYPVDTKGADALPNITINVKHFVEMASRLGWFLSCCMKGMDLALDMKREYLADMLSKMDRGY